jgi:hypothetical protein
VGEQVLYNLCMSFKNQKQNLRIFLYFLLFIGSFLIFDSATVVASVLLAVGALDHFISKSEQNKER